VPCQKHHHRELHCDCGLLEIAVSVLPTGHFGRSVSIVIWRVGHLVGCFSQHVVSVNLRLGLARCEHPGVAGSVES
jgi:hypothetical protein